VAGYSAFAALSCVCAVSVESKSAVPLEHDVVVTGDGDANI